MNESVPASALPPSRRSSHRHAGRSKRVLAFACLGGHLLLAIPTGSSADELTRMVGFPGEAARQQLALEERFAASLDAANLQSWLRHMSARPHHTGSAGSRAIAEFVAGEFSAWGYQTEIETYYVLMPTPRQLAVEMVAPHSYRASLTEPVIPGRTPDATEGSLPPYNAYSRDGDVTAAVVYVNYGAPADYEVLARRGVDVRGKIVIARYGNVWRGTVPRLAGEKGAVGAILYSDPADYGYAQGATYPEGPYLPTHGYQRGSVIDLPRMAGDPLTPGTGAPSKPGAFSLDEALEAIAPVPVLPLSASDISPILEAMTGRAAPPEWHGALPITYRIDGGAVSVRLKVEQNWSLVPVHNVVAKLEGSTFPDEWVLRANNHDAWNYGAEDALSGLSAMMEEARGIAALAKAGWRPRRTLVYLAWDGEEQGLMGSTEFAETHAGELRRKAVAYLNTGPTTQGLFSAGGSHSLETLVDDVTKVVTDPRLKVPVHDRAEAFIRVYGSDEQRNELGTPARYRLAPLGMGADWTPFLQHLGIPSLYIAFEGEAENGCYHSIYENIDHYERFGDPGYRYGVKLAEAGGRIMLRLANADILPFDFSGIDHAIATYAGELERLTDDMRRETARTNQLVEAGLYRLADNPAQALIPPGPREAVPDVDFAPLKEAVATLHRSSGRFSSARAAVESSGTLPDDETLARVNALVAHAEQAFAPDGGLPGRPWYRHHVYAPGRYTGYEVKTLPGVREAIEGRLWTEAGAQTVRAAQLIAAYAAEIDSASRILEAKSP